MKLIVGLGNPGRLYIDSRHNLGFSVVRAIARNAKAALKNDSRTFSLSVKVRFGTEIVILALPLTFMNLSGNAVKALLKKHKIGLRNLLVVCDDLDLELGRMKIRASGSCGGHRGLESITGSLGSNEFARLRLGIGGAGRERDAAEYVLSPFNRREKAQLPQIMENAARCCRFWVLEGIEKSMNIFNKATRGAKDE